MAHSVHHIVFLERDSIEASVRPPAFPHTWVEHDRLGPEQAAAALADATIAIVNKTRLGAATLSRLPHLQLIALTATGTDNIDLHWCARNGIAVSNVRNYAVHTVPEHAFALILALRRSLFGYARDIAAGRWQESEQFCLSGRPVNDIFGSTIGIFGEGALGQGVAALAQGFGMRVLFADHPPPRVSGVHFTPPDQVLGEADIVSLHAPLTPATRNLIGERELGLMKKTALLINTARGGLVDERALAAALRAGRIAGAGFDVLTTEPPREGNPLLDPDIPNLILTPHTAWASSEAVQALIDQVIDNVEAFAAGSPRNLVT